MNLDRPYNAHTRRSIATASTIVIHLDQSEHEISLSAAPIKIISVHWPKITSIPPSEVSLSRVDYGNIELMYSQLFKYDQLFRSM